MDRLPFTDVSGRLWDVYDFKMVERRRRAVPIGHWSAEARAFVPVDREGPVMIYSFGRVAYHDPTPRTFEGQLQFAKPLGASAGERMDAAPS